jgi:hypothetical protein
MMSLTSCGNNTQLGSPFGLDDIPLDCTGWKKIDLHPDDKLTSQTSRKIIGHNRYGEWKRCWPAKEPKPGPTS